MRISPNKYAGRCSSCTVPVPELGGFVVALTPESGWKTYCKSSACLPKPAVTTLTARRLRADGRIEMPFEREALPFIKQMPGARYVPPEWGGPYWQVSTDPKHRAKVLHIAQSLKLTPDPEWLVADDGEPFEVVDPTKVPAAVINAAVERAKLAGLYDYQVLGVRFITENKRCLLGDDMGLGKSAQSLLAIPDGYGALVVVPASVKYNWERECLRWRPDLKPRVLNSAHAWDALMPEPGVLLIINPDMLPKEPPEDLPRADKVMVIADEAHLYKNTATRRHKLMKVLCSRVDRVCIMTGTPMTNRPPDLWGTLAVADLAKSAFGSLQRFRQLFNAVKAGLTWEWGEPDPSVPSLLRKVMLRRTQDEVLKELPPYTESVHLCSKAIDPDLLDLLDETYEAVKKELDARELPDFTRMAKVRSLLASAKIAEMHELLDEYAEREEPVVVFSAHKPPVQSAAARPGWALITGETKLEERQLIVERFQRGELKGIALTIAAGGVGITLTRAAHMLFVDLDWTPALNNQAMCRIRRIGQKADHLFYTRMSFRHPLDERVEELLAWKTELFRLAIDNVTSEYKVPEPVLPSQVPVQFDPIDYTPLAVIEETPEQMLQRKAKAQALRAEESARAALVAARANATEAREAAIAAARGRAAAHAMPSWLSDLRKKTPAFVTNCISDRGSLRQAIQALLGACDGAHTKDDVGFNATDAMVARGLWLLDIEGDAEVAETVARLLYKYRRQLNAHGFAHLYLQQEAPV